MSRELNKIFDAKTREARRRILDKFDISNEDKNEVLNKIGKSSSGGDSNIEYLDVSGFGMTDNGSPSDELFVIVNAAICVKGDFGGEGTAVLTGTGLMTLFRAFGDDLYGMIKAVLIDYNLIITVSGQMTIKELLLNTFTQEQLDAIPRITKEEFYSLEIPE